MSSEKQSSSSGIVDTLKTLLIAGAIALSFAHLWRNRSIFRPDL